MLRMVLCCAVGSGFGATPTSAGTGTLRGAIADGGGWWVYVDGAGPQPTDPTVEVIQSGTQFWPNTSLVVVQGTRVEFHNAGPDLHQVYSLYQVSPFELESYPAPESRDTVLDTVGLVQVRCNLHAEMRLDILVVPNAWFTQADKDGGFTLPGVSAGDHTIVAWSPRGSRRVTARVAGGAVTPVTFPAP